MHICKHTHINCATGEHIHTCAIRIHMDLSHCPTLRIYIYTCICIHTRACVRYVYTHAPNAYTFAYTIRVHMCTCIHALRIHMHMSCLVCMNVLLAQFVVHMHIVSYACCFALVIGLRVTICIGHVSYETAHMRWLIGPLWLAAAWSHDAASWHVASSLSDVVSCFRWPCCSRVHLNGHDWQRAAAVWVGRQHCSLASISTLTASVA